MTSIQKFQIVASPNANIAALNQIRNIGYYNSKLWWAAQHGSALYVQSAPSITGATTNEHTNTGAGPMSMDQVQTACLRNYGQKIYAGMIGQSKFITSYYFGWRVSYSTNGGTSWTDVELNDDLQASSVHTGTLVDFFFDGTIHWMIYVRAKTATAAVLTFYDLAGGTAYTQSMTTTDRERVWGGYYLSGHYYMMIHDGTNLKDVDFNCTTYAFTLATSALATPANFNANAQLLWYQNGTYYLLNQRGFHIKAKTTSTWTSYGPLGSASITVGAIWAHDSSDNYVLNYLIWDDRIYRLDLFNGGVGAIQDVDMGARVGYSDWYVDDDGDDIYQSNYYNANFMHPIANYQRRGVPYGSIMNVNTTLFANQMLVIYKPSTTTIEYIGFVEFNPQRPKTDLLYRLINPLELDLYRPITYSCSGLTSVQIRTALLNTYCNFAKPGTFTGSGTTYTIVSLTARIIDILNLLDYLEKYVWYAVPNCSLNSDLGTTDTTIDIAAGTDLFAKHHKSILELEYGKVTVTGGFGTTAVTVDTQPEFGIAYFRFPLISVANQSLLTTLATNLSAVINTTLEIHQFITSQKDLLQPGQQCTAVNTIGQALATGQWFIKSTQLHIDNRRQTVTLENKLQLDLQVENGYNAAIATQAIDETIIAAAPKNSPAFTGTPTAPTATAGTNTTQVATTAFVATSFVKKTGDSAITTQDVSVGDGYQIDLNGKLTFDQDGSNGYVKSTGRIYFEPSSGSWVGAMATEGLLLNAKPIIGNSCVFCSLYNTAGTTMNNGSDTIIPFSEYVDEGSNWSTDTFTAPTAGLYKFDFNILLASSANWGAGETFEINIYVNGSRACSGSRWFCQAAGTYYVQGTANLVLKLAANDTVKFYGYNGSGGNINIYNGSAYYNWLIITQLRRDA